MTFIDQLESDWHQTYEAGSPVCRRQQAGMEQTHKIGTSPGKGWVLAMIVNTLRLDRMD